MNKFILNLLSGIPIVKIRELAKKRGVHDVIAYICREL